MDFDWSAGLVDRATACIPAVEPPNASDDSGKLSHDAGSDDSDAAMLTTDLAAHVRSTAQSVQLGDDPKVDAEFDRFERVAVPMADGAGLFDPTQQPVPVGVPGADWDAFVRDTPV